MRFSSIWRMRRGSPSRPSGMARSRVMWKLSPLALARASADWLTASSNMRRRKSVDAWGASRVDRPRASSMTSPATSRRCCAAARSPSTRRRCSAVNGVSERSLAIASMPCPAARAARAQLPPASSRRICGWPLSFLHPGGRRRPQYRRLYNATVAQSLMHRCCAPFQRDNGNNPFRRTALWGRSERMDGIVTIVLPVFLVIALAWAPVSYREAADASTVIVDRRSSIEHLGRR